MTFAPFLLFFSFFLLFFPILFTQRERLFRDWHIYLIGPTMKHRQTWGPVFSEKRSIMAASWLFHKAYHYRGRRKCTWATELGKFPCFFACSLNLLTPLCLGAWNNPLLFSAALIHTHPHVHTHTQKVTKSKDTQETALKDRQTRENIGNTFNR